MQNTIERYSEDHREDALADLTAELAEFNHDGLVQLREDLARCAVVRGSWAGCVISYKRGAPGSARRDRLGRARNAFTVLWDNGWLTDEEVVQAVELELQRRHDSVVPTPERAEVGISAQIERLKAA
jgi:hypothetical protein